MQSAWELRDVGNACLDELRHARVLSIADFRPGDQITMEVVLKGHERPPERYLISDVIWSKRDEYHYEVWRLTKAGRPYERGGQTWLTPSTRIRNLNLRRQLLSVIFGRDQVRGGKCVNYHVMDHGVVRYALPVCAIAIRIRCGIRTRA